MKLDSMESDLLKRLAQPHLPEIVRALYFVGVDNWHAAHQIAQKKEGDPMYDRIHAFLHRVEGDTYNAGYWYKRIGQDMPNITLQEEWLLLAKQYLEIK
jgi:hypothetical protein